MVCVVGACTAMGDIKAAECGKGDGTHTNIVGAGTACYGPETSFLLACLGDLASSSGDPGRYGTMTTSSCVGSLPGDGSESDLVLPYELAVVATCVGTFAYRSCDAICGGPIVISVETVELVGSIAKSNETLTFACEDARVVRGSSGSDFS